MENNLSRKIELLMDIIRNLETINNEFYYELSRLRSNEREEVRKLEDRVRSLTEQVETLTREKHEMTIDQNATGVQVQRMRDEIEELKRKNEMLQDEKTKFTEELSNRIMMYLENNSMHLQNFSNDLGRMKISVNDVSAENRILSKNNSDLLRSVSSLFGEFAEHPDATLEVVKLKKIIEMLEKKNAASASSAAPMSGEGGFSEKQEPDDAFSN